MHLNFSNLTRRSEVDCHRTSRDIKDAERLHQLDKGIPLLKLKKEFCVFGCEDYCGFHEMENITW